MRLKDKVAIVVGAGQSPGEGIGNGRATALTFGREGAPQAPLTEAVVAGHGVDVGSPGRPAAFG